jgi:hypothetical protein
MPEKTIKRRRQDCDTALASDDGQRENYWRLFPSATRIRLLQAPAVDRLDAEAPVAAYSSWRTETRQRAFVHLINRKNERGGDMALPTAPPEKEKCRRPSDTPTSEHSHRGTLKSICREFGRETPLCRVLSRRRRQPRPTCPGIFIKNPRRQCGVFSQGTTSPVLSICWSPLLDDWQTMKPCHAARSRLWAGT